jgi:hypothetical protein
MYPDEELILLGYNDNRQIVYPYINGGLKIFFDDTKDLETFKMILSALPILYIPYLLSL